MNVDLSTNALLTRDEVAALLRLDPRTVVRYGIEGKLEQVRLSTRTYRYTRESVQRLMTPSKDPSR